MNLHCWLTSFMPGSVNHFAQKLLTLPNLYMTSKTGSFPGGLRSGKQPVFFLANSLYKKSATIVILQLTFVISRSPREGRRLHLGVFSRFLPHSTSCSPREGCRLHLRSGWNGTYGASVAVPVRGADCIVRQR